MIDALRVVSAIPPDSGLTNILNGLPSNVPSIGSTEELDVARLAVTPACLRLRKISSLSVSLSFERTIITSLLDEDNFSDFEYSKPRKISIGRFIASSTISCTFSTSGL